MGVDGDLTSIIREIVQFLESLYDVDLPSKIENVRINLLQRSKTKLSSITSRGSVSPEPYLDMNAGKGFLLFPTKKTPDIEIEEYVGIEEQKIDCCETTSQHDYYESFLAIDSTKYVTSNDSSDSLKIRRRRRSSSNKSCRKLQPRDEQVENKLFEIYRTFTAAKTISKSHKSGAIYQKIERKPFGFVRGNIRQCWIGLVGSHLLIHGSEDDKQPPEICSIRGYTARPAPNSVTKDPERAKSAFEIFCPGNKTLQFIAKSPKEMEDWLESINRTCTRIVEDENTEEENIVEEETKVSESKEEKYQDVGQVIKALKIEDPIVPIITNDSVDDNNDDNGKKFDTTRNSIILSSSPPILPIRMIPRRLPSLPNDETVPLASYEPLNVAYEDDDIYHKIEDIRDDRKSYENVKKTKKSKKPTKTKKKKRKEEILQIETYDDVESKDITTRRNKIENNETYDDVRSVIENKRISNICESLEESLENKDRSFECYDDILQSSSSSKICHTKDSKQMKLDKNSTKSDKSPTKSDKSPTKSDKSPTKSDKNSTKSPHKRSFLDRVRHRKDSTKKDEKKRSKESIDDKNFDEESIITSSNDKSSEIVEEQIFQRVPTNLDLPMYDDVSDFMIDAKNSTNENKSPTTRNCIKIDEISNYNCPPPPRPIYSKPASPVVVVVPNVKKNEISSIDEIYDDIGNCRENFSCKEIISANDVNEKFGANNILMENNESEVGKNETIEKIEKNNRKVGNIYTIGSSQRNSRLDEEKGKISLEMTEEHYQIPRGDSVQVVSVVQVEEQLYDDIAILADFRAKQRDTSSISKVTCNKLKPDVAEKSSIIARKPWNRFGSVKKISSRDSSLSAAQTSSSSSMRNKSSLEHDVDSSMDNIVIGVGEKQDSTKLNKLQKLISKMECTLGKQASSKSSIAPNFDKTHNNE